MHISILGSTGSIGCQTLEVIESLGSGYRVVALTARRNSALLAEQVLKFEPRLAVLSDETAAADLAARLRGVRCRVEAGPAGQLTAARWPDADLVVSALVGFSGFEPTLAALEAGKVVALANKESLVAGGELFAARGLLRRGLIRPVDSEHSALWQCLGETPPERVSRILLTASGGPFREWEEGKLAEATPAEALAHPNWRMGAKISVDSATLMNKGFEVLEASWLFGVDLDRIEVVIHPQSIIHSMVEFIDGSIIAQLGPPDMRLPIRYALTYPERRASAWPRLGLYGQTWDFREPDRARFPCLGLAYRAGRIGGTAPACLNAANEVAVERFLQGRLPFTGIPRLIAKVLAAQKVVDKPGLEEIRDADRWAREKAEIVAGELAEGSGD